MHRYVKLVFALASATAAMAAMVGTASANRLSISAQNLRATWTEVRLRSSSGLSITCALTLEGSLHSATITKTEGALIGYINRASLASCVGGSARINTESLPWHERYRSFTGTLPNIESIITRSTGSVYETNILGIQCHWVEGSTGRTEGSYALSSGVVREVHLSSSGYTSTINASACGTGSLSSSAGNETVQGTSTRVTVTLI